MDYMDGLVYRAGFLSIPSIVHSVHRPFPSMASISSILRLFPVTTTPLPAEPM